MKLADIKPKNLFRSKKTRSASRSNPPSFGSGIWSSSSESSSSVNLKITGGETPKSVLPFHSSEFSSDLPEISFDNHLELVQVFKFMDRDGDGKITRTELGTLLSRLGAEPPSDEELLKMMSEVDPDGDGCISLEEFGAIKSAFGPACTSELREIFDIFDVDRDGNISAEELLGVFMTIGDDRCKIEDCRKMIRSVDGDGDGFVCFEDFSRMMEQQI